MSSDLEEGRSLDLGYYGAVLRRRWRVVVAFLVLGVALSSVYLAFAPKTVTGTAAVNVTVISAQAFTSDKPPSQLLDTQTELQIATSAQVLGTAADTLGNGKSLAQMRASTTVQPVAGATIFKIGYSAPTKAEATAGADAIASAYVSYRTEAAVTKVTRAVNKLSKQRDELRKTLLEDNKKIAQAASSGRTRSRPRATAT